MWWSVAKSVDLNRLTTFAPDAKASVPTSPVSRSRPAWAAASKYVDAGRSSAGFQVDVEDLCLGVIKPGIRHTGNPHEATPSFARSPCCRLDADLQRGPRRPVPQSAIPV